MAVHYARCSGEDADDLRQEAWLGLLEALPNLDVRIGDPEQYLVRYARWRLLDAVRRARLRRCDSLNTFLENVWSEDGPESALSRYNFVSALNATRTTAWTTLWKPFLWPSSAISCR
jgi:RNA polymerase sigma-70 factor (ECF subfamily)